MLAGKILNEFEVNGEEVLIRYPTMKDAQDLQEHVNSLVEENAKITLDKKRDLQEEVEFLACVLKGVEKNERIFLVSEINESVMGKGEVILTGKGVRSHVGFFEIDLNKEVRGMGIGEKLAKSVISEAKERLDVEILELGVYENNEVAKKLFKKLGFETVGIERDGVKKDDKYINSIIMTKDLRN